jgi:hypothetical protein
MSLAALHRDAGQAAGSRDLLRQVYSSFGEGFGTADLQQAQQLLPGPVYAGQVVGS